MRHAQLPRERVQLDFKERSRAKQSFKDECDINNIMTKYVKTGLVSHVNKYGGRYGDLAGEVDYQNALDTIQRAKEVFAALPASIRTRFENDPAQFLGFVEDPANREELLQMGLLKTRPVPPLMASEGDKPKQSAQSKKGTTPIEDSIQNSTNTPSKSE